MAKTDHKSTLDELVEALEAEALEAEARAEVVRPRPRPKLTLIRGGRDDG